jgi:tetratricopeptide (TPR) repeat protein
MDQRSGIDAKRLIWTLVAVLFLGVGNCLTLVAQEPQKDPLEAQLDEVRKLSRTGFVEDAQAAVKVLESIPLEKLDDSQKDSWVSLARDNALQLGDLERLKKLSTISTTFPADKIYEVLLAYGKLTRANVAEASEILDNIDTAELNPREERRVFALRAKMARMEGDTKKERQYIEKMVEHLPFWPDSNCQACHNDLKNPDKVTSIGLSDLWFGKRYAELMDSQGDANRVREEAEALLKTDPEDVSGLIQLGYARLSQGDTDGAKEAFAKVPFSKESKTEAPAARMLFAFP